VDKTGGSDGVVTGGIVASLDGAASQPPGGEDGGIVNEPVGVLLGIGLDGVGGT